MTTARRPSLKDEIRAHGEACDRYLELNYGMSFRTYKTIKALVQLAGMAVVIYAMYLGVDVRFALTVGLVIYLGPQGIDYLLNREAVERTTTRHRSDNDE